MAKARHIGLVVGNLDIAVDFYQNVFDFAIVARRFEDSPQYISRLVGLDDVDIEWAKLHIADGVLLELLQYHSHPSVKPKTPYQSQLHGCSHFALTVEDAEEISKKIIKHGGSCVSEPLLSPDGKVKVFYAHDRDGIILEIVEPLDS